MWASNLQPFCCIRMKVSCCWGKIKMIILVAFVTVIVKTSNYNFNTSSEKLYFYVNVKGMHFVKIAAMKMGLLR